jgi:HK97 family phage portal protein
MGLLQRLFRRGGQAEQDGAAATEQRALDANSSFARAFGVYPTGGGHYVSPHLAENLSVYVACINAVASTLAAQPVYVYRRSGGDRVEAPDHPVARITRRPSHLQTWSDWLELAVADALSTGNHVSEIEFDGAGRPIALLPIPWSACQPVLLPGRRLAFDVTDYTSAAPAAARRRRLLPGEFFHLKDRQDDGVLGRARISRAPEVVGNARSLQEFTSAMWVNQATPSGVVSLPGPITQENMDRLKASVEQRHAGTANARSILIMSDGASWKPMSMDAESAEVLASRRFSVEELARLMGVPAPVIGDLTHASFTNSETMLRFFAQGSLAFWARRVELEFSRSVFTEGGGASLEISLDGLLRGDPAQRWAAHQIALQNQVLSVAEVRQIEGFNARPAQPAPQPATPVIG